MATPQIKRVPCPMCGNLAEFSPNNPYRPFCSERCKMIDLGAWSSEDYKIPVTPTNHDSLSDGDLEDIH